MEKEGGSIFRVKASGFYLREETSQELACMVDKLKHEIRQKVSSAYFTHLAKFMSRNWNEIVKEFSQESWKKDSRKRKATAGSEPENMPRHLRLSQEYVQLVNRTSNHVSWIHRPSLKRISTVDELYQHYESRSRDKDDMFTTFAPRKKVKRGTWEITRGRFSQNVFCDGLPCTAIAATSIVWSYKNNQKDLNFTPAQVDEVLWLGMQYYRECRRRFGSTDEGFLLAADEIGGDFISKDMKIAVTIQVQFEEVWQGLLDTIPGDDSLRLRASLGHFLNSEYSYAIVTINEKSMALIKHKDALYVFDSHCNGPDGIRAENNDGTACVKKYLPPRSHQVRQISSDLHQNCAPLETPNDLDSLTTLEDQQSFIYSITPLVLTDMKKLRRDQV